MYGNELFKMPIPIGGYVYDKNFPMFPQTVMGYRIGRMMGEDQEEYEDGGYKDGAWYIFWPREWIIREVNRTNRQRWRS